MTLDVVRERIINGTKNNVDVSSDLIDKQNSIGSYYTFEKVRTLISIGEIDSVELLSLLYQGELSLSYEDVEVLISHVNFEYDLLSNQHSGNVSRNYRNDESSAYSLLENITSNKNYRDATSSVWEHYIKTVLISTEPALVNLVSSTPLVFMLLFICMSLFRKRKNEYTFIA